MHGRLWDLCRGTNCTALDSEAYRRLWDGIPQKVEEHQRRTLACSHRHSEESTVLCPTCNGSVRVKVFGCKLHKQCTVSRSVGLACCATCPDYLASGTTICVRMTSVGIGDTLLGLTSVAGLRKQHPDAYIVYSVQDNTASWVNLFSDASSVGQYPGGYDPYPATYKSERLGSKTPRWEAYAARCGTIAVLPTLHPLPDEIRLRGKVVFAPWAAYLDRMWPLEYWHQLERILTPDKDAIIIGCEEHRDQAIGFAGTVLLGQSPETIAKLMKASLLVVGNDSGMVHLAGCLGVPAVAICGPTCGEQVFGFYPSVTWVHSISSLLELTPETVVRDIACWLSGCGSILAERL